MRILLASTSSGSHGGGEISLSYLGRALSEMGHTVALWVSDHERMNALAERFSAFGEVIRAPYINTYDLRGRSLSSYFHRKNRSVAIETWRAWKPDIVHINKQNLEDGLDLLLAVKKCGIPHVCFIHITQTARYLKASNARLRDWVSRKALQSYNGALATAGDAREDDLRAFSRLPADRIRCIYNGTSDPRRGARPEWQPEFRSKLGLREDDVLIVMTARLTAQKAPEKFLELAEEVHRSMQNAQFLWIGPGDMEDLWDRHVAEKKMGGYVRRIGWQDDVRPWLAAADAYLHTAAYEGMPFAILEALSMGVPCILTRPMIEQIAAFNLTDVSMIEDPSVLVKQLSDRDHLRIMGERARSLYEKHFRAETMAQHFVDLYISLVA